MLLAEFKAPKNNSAGTPHWGCSITSGRRAPEIPCKTVTASWSSGFGTLQTFPKSTESAKTWLKSKTKGRSTFFCILSWSRLNLMKNSHGLLYMLVHLCTRPDPNPKWSHRPQNLLAESCRVFIHKKASVIPRDIYVCGRKRGRTDISIRKYICVFDPNLRWPQNF